MQQAKTNAHFVYLESIGRLLILYVQIVQQGHTLLEQDRCCVVCVNLENIYQLKAWLPIIAQIAMQGFISQAKEQAYALHAKLENIQQK